MLKKRNKNCGKDRLMVGKNIIKEKSVAEIKKNVQIFLFHNFLKQ